MVYAAQSDLVPLRLPMQRLVQLTTEDKAATVPDPDVVSAALAEASGRVESYCGQRYALPLQSTLMVKSATVDIAIYLLYTRRGDLRPTETPAIRYAEAMVMLKDIAAGRASLDQPDAPLQTQLASGEAVVSQKPQRFSDCNLEGWA